MLVIAAANVYVHDFKIPAAGFKHFLAIAAQYDAIAAQYDVDACHIKSSRTYKCIQC